MDVLFGSAANSAYNNIDIYNGITELSLYG